VPDKLPGGLIKTGRHALSIVGREALRIVLPSWCVSCERELPWRGRTASCCGDCWTSLPSLKGPKCRSCSQPAPLADVSQFVCLRCETDPLPLEWCDAWGSYRGGLERLLQALKFQRHDFLAEALAGLLDEMIRSRGDLQFDAIVAVPMHRSHERRRGYNQAELLSRELSKRTGIPYEGTLLKRVEARATQSTLPRRQRAANVRGAFAAATEAGERSLLLVDDVCTTGETLRACASALRNAGAERVCAAVVAKSH
jgi:ComF family protein